jgi:hypothetical protein
MKKQLAVLAGAGLGLGFLLGTPHISLAQGGAASGPFADVPADHWAYQSVDTLQKAGIVIGYPDGTYGGKRAMTRYEFAVAIARLLPLIKPPDLSAYAQKTDLQALSDDLNAKLANNAQAIDALKALVNEFQGELQKLGQDVAAIQQRLDALEARVAAVEAEQRRVRFTGDLDLIARGDVSTKSNGVYKQFYDQNGVLTGSAGAQGHLLQTSDVYHNFDLNIEGRLSDTATAYVKANFNNYLSALGNTASVGEPFGIHPGQLTGGDSTQTSLYEAYVDAPVKLGPLSGATVDVGRIPVQFSKYTLKQVDADAYTYLYETDSGNLPVDGGKLAFKVGPVKAVAFAGKMDTLPFSQAFGGATTNAGGQFRPTGQIFENQASPLSQGAGVRASVGTLGTLQINGTLEEFGLTNAPNDPDTGVSYNKLTVYGADINGALPFKVPFVKKGAIGVDASYTNSEEGGLKTNANYGYKYMQQEEQLTGQFGGLNLKGGYQYVGPYFTAPGYWGRIGSWTNPTNIEGPVVSAKFALTPKVTLNGDYEQYKAAYAAEASPLQSGDRINRYQVGVGYGLSSANSVDLGYEDVEYDLRDKSITLTGGAGKPRETYLTFGVGHNFNSNSSFKLLYQIVRYDDKGTGFDPNGSANGGVAVGQFSLKF